MSEEITLCFGVFAKLMNICKDTIRESDQARFITKMISILDPGNSCIHYNNPYTGTTGTDENRPVVTRLLKCQQNFTLSASSDEILNNKQSFLEQFKGFIADYMDIDLIPGLVVTLIDIIKNDKYVKQYSRELFKKLFGCYIEEFKFNNNQIVVYDFLGNLFIYTAFNTKIKNTSCANIISEINEEYIRSIYTTYENDLTFDAESLTLTLDILNVYFKFKDLLDEYSICKFVGEVDPTTELKENYVDQCEAFLKKVNAGILHYYPYTYSICQKIAEFSNALNNYIDFLGVNMVYKEDKVSTQNDMPQREKSNKDDISTFIFIKMNIFDWFIENVEGHRQDCKDKKIDIDIFVKLFLNNEQLENC